MIFLGLGDICGYYSQLERGLLDIGVKVTLVNAFPAGSYARATQPPRAGQIVERIALRRAAALRGSWRRRWLTFRQAVAMVPLFLWAIRHCDVFVFSGGTSFFPPYDLWLLKRLGKRIVVIFHGSDARPPYINGAVPCESADEVAAVIAETIRMKTRMRRIEAHADVIVNHAMSSHFHERPVVAWLNIGIPSAISAAPARRPAGTACVIVHAPTRPGPKGSAIFEAAIEDLRRQGHEITFVKLVGKTNAEVLDAIQSCDFVVDELFSDTTMASFAMEAATFGKAAVVGLTDYALLQQLTAEGMMPPAVVCDAAGAAKAIERLVVDPALRAAKGLEARQFIEKQWSAPSVAERVARLCSEAVPSTWCVDPAKVPYLYGWGLTREQARRRIAAVVRAGGVGALHLSDKPDVESAFAAFAAERSGC